MKDARELQAAGKALIAWFRSQEISLPDSVHLMLFVMGNQAAQMETLECGKKAIAVTAQSLEMSFWAQYLSLHRDAEVEMPEHIRKLFEKARR